MLRTSGSGDDKKPEVGDIRLFVDEKGTERSWQYSIGRKPWWWKPANVLPSPVGEVIFDDVRTSASTWRSLRTDRNYEFSVPLTVLGLKDPVGKTFRGDAGFGVERWSSR